MKLKVSWSIRWMINWEAMDMYACVGCIPTPKVLGKYFCITLPFRR